ncbi:hypothetical protein NV379_02315 [Paenibacillus sp. N1-5-1-14]|uniref:hypothetical protein n=1 Tax=Paenibacillus radicibacter TaxID=2972488 RepID=UPI0021593511|nr:hypothetical protein [Paenibacillus radicibacter]MCR8641481.1 hypothetical protein [Paenibacillus radicibacter]
MDNKLNYDKKYYRNKRREKEIPLSGALAKYVGTSYGHILQWEKKENHPMQRDKIERYVAYIEAYPEEPLETNINV